MRRTAICSFACRSRRLGVAHCASTPPDSYRFEAIGSGPYTVRLDGKPLFSMSPEAPEQPARSIAERSLDPGLHPIEADFDSTRRAHTSRRVLQLFWTPPGGQQELIPPGNFVPPG